MNSGSSFSALHIQEGLQCVIGQLMSCYQHGQAMSAAYLACTVPLAAAASVASAAVVSAAVVSAIVVSTAVASAAAASLPAASCAAEHSVFAKVHK